MGYEAQHIKLNRGSNNKYSLSRVPYGIRIDCIIRIVLVACAQGVTACGRLQREDVYVHRPRHSSHSLCPSHVLTAVLVVEEDCKLNPSAAAAWRMSSGTGKALYAGRSAWH